MEKIVQKEKFDERNREISLLEFSLLKELAGNGFTKLCDETTPKEKAGILASASEEIFGHFYREWNYFKFLDLDCLKFLEKLGEGTFGHVYKILWGERTYAIKLFDCYFEEKHAKDNKLSWNNEIIIESCLGLHEAKALLSMTLKGKTTNIIKFYDFGFTSFQENVYSYIVTEYVEGKTLWNFRDNFQPDSFFLFSKMLFSAVSDLHSKGIAHLDITPNNVMIDKENCVKLIDFGLCSMKKDRWSDYTFSTMNPPENYEINEDNDITFREKCAMDVWCCAYTMLYILCFDGKQIPFPKRNTREEAIKDVQDKLEKAKEKLEIPQMFLKALENVPEKRPTARQVMNSLI